MTAELRPATLADHAVIMDALLKMLDKSPAPQMKYADENTARAHLYTAIRDGMVWFVGGYMIMVDVGSDWYSNRKYLIEQMILKAYPFNKAATVRDAIAALDTLREHYGCVLTAVGDTQIGMMTPLYLEAGYLPVGTQLIKENYHRLGKKEDGDSRTD